MSKRLRTLIVAVSVLTSALAGAWSPALAGGIYQTDGNDTAGPLDLASMRLTEIKDGDRFEIRTLTAFTSGQLNGVDGWFEVDFDTNADRDYETWVVVYYYKGKLVAVHGKGSTAIRTLPVRRVDKRTVSFDISHRNVGDVTSYDFVIYSVWRAAPCAAKDCVDTIPNKYPLIRHDFTAPKVRWLSPRDITTLYGDSELPFSITFLVQDDKYGSGLDHWTVQRRDEPSGAWSTVSTGTAKEPTVLVPGDEGAHYGLRVIAVDHQANKGVSSIMKISVPLDDRNAALTYSAGVVPVTRTGAYLDTVTQLAQGESVSFTFTFGTQAAFCLVLGHPETPGTNTQAQWSFDGQPSSGAFNESDSTQDVETGTNCASPGSGTHTITITGTSVEPFVIDGVVQRG